MKKIFAVLLFAAMMIGLAVAANASVGTVVYANKTDKAPNLEEIDASWGEPAIVLSKNSDNTELYTYINERNAQALQLENKLKQRELTLNQQNADMGRKQKEIESISSLVLNSV